MPPSPRLAIVGSRAAHRHFRDAVVPIVAAARSAGWSVVSGGAIGIDGDAHRAALALGVPQVAVLPCGPDRVYPPRHEPLFDEIVGASASGVLFAQPPGAVSCRGMFASRNAVVVDLCEAVVVVEATPRSGTMITAKLAKRKKRARAAIVGSAGAAMLVADGAYGLAWEPDEPDELQKRAEGWLRAVVAGEAVPQQQMLGLSWPEHLEWLRVAIQERGAAGVSVEELPSPRTALVALTEAEDLGLVVERSGGRFVALG